MNRTLVELKCTVQAESNRAIRLAVKQARKHVPRRDQTRYVGG